MLLTHYHRVSIAGVAIIKPGKEQTTETRHTTTQNRNIGYHIIMQVIEESQ